MKRLYFMQTNTTPGCDIIDGMLAAVPAEKRDRLLRYRNEEDRVNSLYGDILVRCLVCEFFGTPLRDVVIETGKNGKPFLPGTPPCAFSISHTKGALAAAFSDDPVGVDIEKIRVIDPVIGRKVFTEKEMAWVTEPGGETERRFFTVWTKKEALVKRSGEGLSGGIRLVDVIGGDGRGILSTLEADDYIISVCASEKFNKEDLTRITETDLVRLWRRCNR